MPRAKFTMLEPGTGIAPVEEEEKVVKNPFKEPPPNPFEANMEEMEQRVYAAMGEEPNRVALEINMGTSGQEQEVPGINQNLLEYFRQQMEQTMHVPETQFHQEGIIGAMSGRTVIGHNSKTLNISATGRAEMFQLGGEYDIQLDGKKLAVLVTNKQINVEHGERVTSDLTLRVLKEY